MARRRTLDAARRMRTGCDLSPLVPKRRGEGLARGGRAYMITAVETARHLLRARRRFDVREIRMRPVADVPDRIRRSWAGEFLSAWERASEGRFDRGDSFGAKMALDACPRLAERAKKYWRGW